MKIPPDVIDLYAQPMLRIVKTQGPISIPELYARAHALGDFRYDMMIAVFWHLMSSHQLAFDLKRAVVMPVASTSTVAPNKSFEPNLSRKEHSMSKKISPEEIVVEFFNTAELIKVETVANIIKTIIKRRLAEKSKHVASATVAAVTRKPRVMAVVKPNEIETEINNPESAETVN